MNASLICSHAWQIPTPEYAGKNTFAALTSEGLCRNSRADDRCLTIRCIISAHDHHIPGHIRRVLAFRDELAAIIGTEAEQLVYFYASCDRRFTYRQLAQPAGLFRDRFTGAVACPPLTLRRDFAELTVANELDIVGVNPAPAPNTGRGSWRYSPHGGTCSASLPGRTSRRPCQ